MSWGLLACRGSTTTTTEVELVARCQPASSLSFVDTQLGQSSFAIVEVSSANGDSIAGVDVSVDGPDAGEFSTSSSCDADDFCTVEVTLSPTSVGDKQATLHIGNQDVPLTATATPQSTGLFANVANLALITSPATLGGPAFQIENLGSAPVTVSPLGTVEGDGFVLGMAYPDCPQPLTAGGACMVAVSVLQVRTGCVSGTAHLGSDLGDIDFPIDGDMVMIAYADAVSGLGGHGHVTSDVGGIDCSGASDGSSCTGHVDAATVTFTATPDPDSVFDGWDDPRCNQSPTCTYRLDGISFAPRVTADFAPATARAIHVTFAGDATGAMWVGHSLGLPRPLEGYKLCTSSCTIYVADGVQASVQAVANSQFSGFAGACTGTDPSCDLGLIVNDRDLTATFSKDPQEASSTAVPVAGTAGYAPDGNLIIVGSSQYAFGTLISRVSPAGSIVGSTFVVGPFQRAAITASGVVYALVDSNPSSLVRVSADGVVQWRIVIGLAGAITAAGEDVIVGNDTALTAYAAADGATQWTQPLTTQPDDIAVGPAGIVAVSTRTDTGDDEILRFTSNGTPVGSGLPLPFSVRVQLRYDATGNLIVLGSGVLMIDHLIAPPRLSVFAPDGTPTVGVDLDTTENSTGDGLVVASDGTIGVLRTHHSFGFGLAYGGFVEAYDLTGARRWQVDKQASVNSQDVTGFGSGVLIAPPASGIQLLGVRNDTDGVPVLETFTP